MMSWKPLAAALVAGALLGQLLVWALTPRHPQDNALQAYVDSVAKAKDAVADSLQRRLRFVQDSTNAELAAALDREQKARSRAAQASNAQRATGEKVEALLDSLGASTEAWVAHQAADADYQAQRDSVDVELVARAALWERRATVAEAASAAEQDARAAANVQLQEALRRNRILEGRAKSAERSATWWKIATGVTTGVSLVQAVR